MLLSEKKLKQWEFIEYEGTSSCETTPNEVSESEEAVDNEQGTKPA